jgi:hypothetical protein
VSRDDGWLIREFSTSRIHHFGHLVQINVVAIGQRFAEKWPKPLGGLDFG